MGAAADRRTSYDPRLRPPPDKRGAARRAWAMTEKQGGSDVRANTTARRAAGGGPGEYPLDRAQVVLLGADVRRVPGARAGAAAG